MNGVHPNRLGIEMLTLLGMNPVDHVRLASALGCTSISTGLGRLPLAMFGHAEIYEPWSLASDAALRGELKAALADTGVSIGLGEGFRVAPGMDVADAAANLDLFADLGAQRINAIGTEPDAARALDQFGTLADMVAQRGMVFMVEFAPPHVLSCAADALAVADALGHDRCGMMLDAMHFFRSGGTVDQVAALPVRYAQLCDAPRVAPAGLSYMDEAMFGRAVPGEGEFPLAEWIAALPADCVIGLEVPQMALVRGDVTPEDHARRCVEAARALGV